MFICLFPVWPDHQELIPIVSVGIKRIRKLFKILNRKTQNIKQNVCSYLKYFNIIILSWWKLLTIYQCQKHEHFLLIYRKLFVFFHSFRKREIEIGYQFQFNSDWITRNWNTNIISFLFNNVRVLNHIENTNNFAGMWIIVRNCMIRKTRTIINIIA